MPQGLVWVHKGFVDLFTISGSRNCTISRISGSRNYFVHFYNFWIQKLQYFCNSWIEKLHHFYNFWGPYESWGDVCLVPSLCREPYGS